MGTFCPTLPFAFFKYSRRFAFRMRYKFIRSPRDLAARYRCDLRLTYVGHTCSRVNFQKIDGEVMQTKSRL